MVTRTDCPCGKNDLSSAQMTMHCRSKAHREWEAAEGGVETLVTGEDPGLEGILAAARLGEDPMHLAKMARSLFASKDWPNDEYPLTIKEWLESHNIPIINVPSHSDPDEGRKYIASEMQRLREAGWGKGWSIT